MRKEEERKTKQKRRIVNAAPEQENEITQKKSAWRSCAGWGRSPAPAAALAWPGPPAGRDSAGERGGRGCRGALGQPRGSMRRRQGSEGHADAGESCAGGMADTLCPAGWICSSRWQHASPFPLPSGCIRATLVSPALDLGSKPLRARWPVSVQHGAPWGPDTHWASEGQTESCTSRAEAWQRKVIHPLPPL